MDGTSNGSCPQIRRLRVCLLGKDSYRQYVAPTDVAAAILRGLTADEPDESDPVIDCAFDGGLLEQSWWGLQEEPPAEFLEAGGSRFDRWGVGSLKAWDGRIRFEPQDFDEKVPHQAEGGLEEYASTCEVDGQNPGRISDTCGGMLGAFRDVLKASRELETEQCAKTRQAKAEREAAEAGTQAAANAAQEGKDPKEAAKAARRKVLEAAELVEQAARKAEEAQPDAYHACHQDLLALASDTPRMLVKKSQPCPGLLASYARYSPEVGDFGASCAIFLNVFEPGFSPWSNYQNTAMICASAPDPKVYGSMSPRAFVYALRSIGANIARTVREYNRMASGQAAPNSWTRTLWHKSDMRARVESFLCDTTIWTDPALQHTIVTATDGWMNLDKVKESDGSNSEAQDAELLDALGDSSYIENKIGEDGVVLVRRPSMQLPGSKSSSNNGPPREKKEWVPEGDPDDPTCWDFVKRGHCKRGHWCRFLHPAPNSEPGAEPVDVRSDAAMLAEAASQFAALLPSMEKQEGAKEVDMESQLRQAVGLDTDILAAVATAGTDHEAVVQPTAEFATQLQDALKQLSSFAQTTAAPAARGGGGWRQWDNKDNNRWQGRGGRGNWHHKDGWSQDGWGNKRQRTGDKTDAGGEANSGGAAPPPPPPPASSSAVPETKPAQQQAPANKAEMAKRESELKEKLLDRKRRFEGW